jgi:mono/diheme cytochrome c family protein
MDMEVLMKRVLCFAIPLMLSAATVQAQELGNPLSGLGLASDVCSRCHAIRRGEGLSPNSRSPTFAELANTPGMTSAALTVALTTPHAGMPMFMFTPEQRQDIIAYILSLKASN